MIRHAFKKLALDIRPSFVNESPSFQLSASLNLLASTSFRRCSGGGRFAGVLPCFEAFGRGVCWSVKISPYAPFLAVDYAGNLGAKASVSQGPFNIQPFSACVNGPLLNALNGHKRPINTLPFVA